MNDSPKHVNKLIHARSPYLLQHAHNPVEWMEWSDEAWGLARSQNKLVLLSIGYSSCHWCHVMERETFENEDTAELMNESFVCIKVDREERPDIDHVYMDAVQLISGRGGWPLNVFCLPDGRPLHGGTYFPNREWNRLLIQLRDLWSRQREVALDYAQKLTQGIRELDVIGSGNESIPVAVDFTIVLENWWTQFDMEYGGLAGSPKFPLPVSLEFLLHAGSLRGHSKAHDMVRLTLNKMARGGIYDVLQGGFARYSVDEAWKVPHFEKMLYDNAQLVSLYSKASAVLNEPWLAQIARQTLCFMEDEWKSPEGLYFSSYDADSDGQEGLYYTWTLSEIRELPEAEAEALIRYYSISEGGNWEHGRNILHAGISPGEFAVQERLPAEWSALLKSGLEKLALKRNLRQRPALDDKCILSWNALALEALATASRYLGEPEFSSQAEALATSIEHHFNTQTGYLRIVKDGSASVSAMLEDLALYARACILLYQSTFNARWLHHARSLCELAIAEYLDPGTGLFYYVSKKEDKLIVRKKELSDNVIPSSNSTMLWNLQRLYYYYSWQPYREMAERMLGAMGALFAKHTPWYARWGEALLAREVGMIQLCFSGPGALEAARNPSLHSIPNLVLAAAESESDIPLLKDKVGEFSAIYPCYNETCYAPVTSVQEALGVLKNLD